MKDVGILCLQGDFERHAEAIRACGASARFVRTAEEIESVDRLIIPGGESTTIGKLMNRFGLIAPLRTRILGGMPVFGTCAGLILLSKQNDDPHQFRLDVLDIDVERNAYGRQVESFESDIALSIGNAEPFRGVFIRAPLITRLGDGIEVLGRFEDRPVFIRSGNILGASFHPELTGDHRVHEFFLGI